MVRPILFSRWFVLIPLPTFLFWFDWVPICCYYIPRYCSCCCVVGDSHSVLHSPVVLFIWLLIWYVPAFGGAFCRHSLVLFVHLLPRFWRGILALLLLFLFVIYCWPCRTVADFMVEWCCAVGDANRNICCVVFCHSILPSTNYLRLILV